MTKLSTHLNSQVIHNQLYYSRSVSCDCPAARHAVVVAAAQLCIDQEFHTYNLPSYR